MDRSVLDQEICGHKWYALFYDIVIYIFNILKHVAVL